MTDTVGERMLKLRDVIGKVEMLGLPARRVRMPGFFSNDSSSLTVVRGRIGNG